MKNEAKPGDLVLELNFKERIKHYQSLVNILKKKALLLTAMEAAEINELTKIELQEKLWYLKTETDAKTSYIIELLARQDKAAQQMKESNKSSLLTLKNKFGSK